MTKKNQTAVPPDEGESDGFRVLQHQLLSANERLKLAADKLSDYEALPEDHVPASFVVEEVTEALARIHMDFNAWYDEHGHTPGGAIMGRVKAGTEASSDEQSSREYDRDGQKAHAG